MSNRQFTGIVRVSQSGARLATRRGVFTLDPYPESAPLPVKEKRRTGKDLFGYLDGHEITVYGTLVDSVIHNARLASTDTPRPATQDVQIAPESKDPFARDFELYFQKDSAEIAAKLNDVGLCTISAFYHRIRNDYDQETRVFAQYLKVPEARIKEFVEKLQSDPTSSGLVRASPRFPVRRGVNLQLLARRHPNVQVTRKAPPAPPRLPATAVTLKLPSSVDNTVHTTKVKDQGIRGTCVAHTAVSCLEAAYIREGKAKPSVDLSEQYLYWGCKALDGAPNAEGTFLEYAAQVLLDGLPLENLPGDVCPERSWPYHSLPVAGNESQGPPPQKARRALAKRQYRASKVTRLKHNNIRVLKEALFQGHCVGLSVYTYHFWTDDFAWREGSISLPLDIEPDGAHAICLVGYTDDDASHREGRFKFKNSWSTKWGYGRPDPGFGELPYRYVLNEAIEAFTLEAMSPPKK